MRSCNGTDGRLNLHKWVWRCSSSIPLSMSANILSMSAFTYNTQISIDLSSEFMSMEKLMWELFFSVFWSSCLYSGPCFILSYPSFHLPSLWSSCPSSPPSSFTEHSCVLTYSVTIDCWSFINLKLLIRFCSTWR